MEIIKIVDGASVFYALTAEIAIASIKASYSRVARAVPNDPLTMVTLVWDDKWLGETKIHLERVEVLTKPEHL